MSAVIPQQQPWHRSQTGPAACASASAGTLQQMGGDTGPGATEHSSAAAENYGLRQEGLSRARSTNSSHLCRQAPIASVHALSQPASLQVRPLGHHRFHHTL